MQVNAFWGLCFNIRNNNLPLLLFEANFELFILNFAEIGVAIGRRRFAPRYLPDPPRGGSLNASAPIETVGANSPRTVCRNAESAVLFAGASRSARDS